MKVYVLPADPHGCGHYRLIWPSNVLQKAGHEIVIMPPSKDSGFMASFLESALGNCQNVPSRWQELPCVQCVTRLHLTRGVTTSSGCQRVNPRCPAGYTLRGFMSDMGE